MTQIKSYLSLESVPSIEFKTPPKNILLNMPTNNSMSYSNTLGSSDYKPLWNKRTFYNSHDIFKEPNYQSRDYVQELSGEIENNSSAVTLSPAVTPIDMAELVNAVKMIAFLSFKNAEDKKRIQIKVAAIETLKKKIAQLQENTAYRKIQFQKKEKVIKSRSLSIRKKKHGTDRDINKEVVDLKLSINKIRRTVSAKKGSNETKRNSNQRRREQPVTDRQFQRKKIYVPIMYSPSFFASSHYYPQTKHSDHHHTQPTPIDKKYGNFELSQQAKVSHRSNSNQSQKTPTSKNSMPPVPLSNGKQLSQGKELSENLVFGLVQQKLRGASNPIVRPPSGNLNLQIKKTANQTPTVLDFLAPALNKQLNSSNRNYKINIVKQQQQKSPNLDYFDDSFQKELDMHQQLLLNSQNSRKSIKALKQSSRGITNKWKNDGQEKQIVQMLEESVRSINKAKQQSNLEDNKALLSPPKNQIGAKLVVTNMKPEDSFEVDHLPDTSREQAKPVQANSSHVDIFVADFSAQKSGNSSNVSEKRLSVKSIDRENIVNSVIGIEMIDSMDEIPHSLDEPKFSPRRMAGLALKKQIEKIEEAEDEGLSRCNTPVDFKLTHHLQPSVQSGYMPTPRDPQALPIANSQSSLQKSSGPHTPPLTRPPSLIQQPQEDEQEEDILESIKLHTESKFSSEPKSKVNRLSKSIDLEQNQQTSPVKTPSAIQDEDDDDFLQNIQLAGMSRISREKRESKQVSIEDFNNVPKVSPEQMVKSDLSPSNQNDEMEIIDSELRKSTNSVIMKRGSAISRSRKEGQSPSGGSGLKSSNRGSMLSANSSSNVLSSPIAEAEEQDDDHSTIIRKHRRNGTTPQP